jgi:hypothetical protein
MAKRKRTKGQTMIYNALHRKLGIELHETYRCSGSVSSSCSSSGTRCGTVVRHEYNPIWQITNQQQQ